MATIPGGIEDIVIARIQERRAKGLLKYGVTMERTDLTRKEWLNHAFEEALDLSIYLQKLIQLEEAAGLTVTAE